MGKSRPWATGGTTPDWLDVECALRALAELYGGVTMVSILPAGIGSTGGLHLAISSTWDRLPGTDLEDVVVTCRETRAYGCESLPAFVLGGVYEHEFAVGNAWQQRSFKE